MYLRKLAIILCLFLLILNGCSLAGLNTIQVLEWYDPVYGEKAANWMVQADTNIYNVKEFNIFSKVREPYTRDLNNTPVPGTCAVDKLVQIKFMGYRLYTEFKSNAIGDIAKQNGISKVYFADMENVSVLGIYQHKKIYIYGE